MGRGKMPDDKGESGEREKPREKETLRQETPFLREREDASNLF